MSTFSQVYLRFVTAVKFRRALIHPAWKEELHRYVTGIVQKKGHKLLAVNTMPDHLHLFVGKRPHEAECDLMRDVKGDASAWINKRGFRDQTFAWQEGYGVFSYTKELVPVVCRYIERQEEHHRKQTFRTEFVGLLDEFGVEYEDRWLWGDPE
ncbi:MAG: IS200/IS605 family transposase [Chitinophagaceae bacterium]|nr:MAG: IS200/IS605 family transposase [Chitinophagaceae bacterium]